MISCVYKFTLFSEENGLIHIKMNLLSVRNLNFESYRPSRLWQVAKHISSVAIDLKAFQACAFQNDIEEDGAQKSG